MSLIPPDKRTLAFKRMQILEQIEKESKLMQMESTVATVVFEASMAKLRFLMEKLEETVAKNEMSLDEFSP